MQVACTNLRLPQPPTWRSLTAEAEQADPDSMLSLYRAALRLRRQEPALGDGSMRWRPVQDGVLAFHRYPGFACLLNVSTVEVMLPAHEQILLASGPLPGGKLPADTAVWLRAS
jgi:alpha-glucosidase